MMTSKERITYRYSVEKSKQPPGLSELNIFRRSDAAMEIDYY
jgi:hypothetical protein